MSGRRTKALRRACIMHLGRAPQKAVTRMEDHVYLRSGDEFRQFRRFRLCGPRKIAALVRRAAEFFRVRLENTCPTCGSSLAHVAEGPAFGCDSLRATMCPTCDAERLAEIEVRA